MAERQPQSNEGLYVSGEQPLVGVAVERDGQEVTHYFVEEDVNGSTVPDKATGQALRLIGAWSDLDWDEVATKLDRIRHESPPSAPIEA